MSVGQDLVNKIRFAKSRVVGDKNSGFQAFFEIDLNEFNSDHLNILHNVFPGVVEDNHFHLMIADNNEEPIIFERQDHAQKTLIDQSKHLLKRFAFTYFSITGEKVDIEDRKSTITFYKPGEVT